MGEYFVPRPQWFLNLSGGTVSGDTLFTNNLSAATYYGDGSQLSGIFSTRVQPGTNIFTAGTGNFPTINLTAATIDNLSVSGDTSLGSVSATTYYGDGSQLLGIFSTRVQPGTNIFTAGTGNFPTINLTAATIDNLSVSGETSLQTLFATTITATTGIKTLNATVGAVQAQFGPSLPFYITANWPTLGFNAYYEGGWKYGAGSSSNYAAYQTFDPRSGYGMMSYSIADVVGNAGDAVANMRNVLNMYYTGAIQFPIGYSTGVIKSDASGNLTSDETIIPRLETFVRRSGDTITGDLLIRGNLTVSGPIISATSENVLISDNLLTLNYLSGSTDISGVTRGVAGIEVDRGAWDDYYFLFNEDSETFRVGTSGTSDNTQAVATREDLPISNGFAYWNSSEYRFDTTTSVSATSIVYRNQELDDRFVNVTGDTMTGDLSVNANLTVTGDTSIQALTASTINISTFTGTAETIITTSGSSRLQQYLTTNSRFISDTTVITDLLTPSKWFGTTYSGTTTGLAEGQEYIGVAYRYIYKDGAVSRYEMADKNIATYTGDTTIGYYNDIVLCNSISAFTVTLIHPSGCTKQEMTIKNINSGIVTVSASTLIDGTSTQTLTYMDVINLFHNGSTYFMR